MQGCRRLCSALSTERSFPTAELCLPLDAPARGRSHIERPGPLNRKGVVLDGPLQPRVCLPVVVPGLPTTEGFGSVTTCVCPLTSPGFLKPGGLICRESYRAK